MAKYTGKTFTVNKPAAEITEKFRDLTSLQAYIDSLPESERAKLGDLDLSFTPDSVAVNTKQVGRIEFVVTERTPQGVKFAAKGSPVPFGLSLQLDPKGEQATDATCAADVEIPPMLRGFIGPQLQKAVDMLSDVMGKLIG